MAFAVSEQIQTASKPYLNPFIKFDSLNSMHAEQSAWTCILTLSSTQYIYIPASVITTQLLVFCCGTALEPDFLTIFSQDAWSTTISYIFWDLMKTYVGVAHCKLLSQR